MSNLNEYINLVDTGVLPRSLFVASLLKPWAFG